MGLIADVVESFVAALGGVALGFGWKGVKALRELPDLASAFQDEAVSFAEAHPTIVAALAVSSPTALAAFTVVGLGSPQSFSTELFRKWSELLQHALGLLNVEDVAPPLDPPIAPELRIAITLQLGRMASQERVTAAITIINFILVSASAVSVAAEVASLGQVEGISAAIQSWVWANGLGSFTPLAFQPQVNASINPYLTRFYNSRAKAQIPPVTDVIRMQLREVFLADRRADLVGTEDRPIFDALMAEWGFDKFHADSYWAAHWQLPNIGQLNEMLFRGVIDRDTWERFVRFNDFEPSSIPNLEQIIFNPYTRVDARRMARLGILSDDELLQAYADLGFFAPTVSDAQGRHRATFVPDPDFTIHKAQALVIFTKVFNAVPELRQRFSKGHISAGEVLTGLVATGIPALRATVISQTIVRAEGPTRTATEKELTRALVARAWKLRLISFPQSVFLLERMGWSEPEAELILTVQSDPSLSDDFIPTVLGIRLGALSEQPPVEEEPP